MKWNEEAKWQKKRTTKHRIYSMSDQRWQKKCSRLQFIAHTRCTYCTLNLTRISVFVELMIVLFNFYFHGTALLCRGLNTVQLLKPRYASSSLNALHGFRMSIWTHFRLCKAISNNTACHKHCVKLTCLNSPVSPEATTFIYCSRLCFFYFS